MTNDQHQSGLWHYRIVQLTVGLVLLSYVLFYAIGGFTEESTRQCIRWSARVAIVLFSMAFTATAVQKLWPGVFTFWWRMNRRYLGISFAIVHLLHLAALVVLQQYFHPVFTLAKKSSLMAGGTAYVFVVLMLFTSFDNISRHLSNKQWKLLHTIGGWWIWGIFASSYFKRVMHGEMGYLPLAALVVVVAVLRVLVLLRKK